MSLLLGVDGGGTKTAARLLSEGPNGRLCLLASGFSGASNPYSVGWPAAEHAVTTAITQALASADEKPRSAVIAVAGCASADARDRLAEWAGRQGFADAVAIVPDTEPILAGLPGDTDAIGLIAGTGSSILARHGSGKTEVVGGWGYLIDDGGSGYALGRDALRQITEDADRGSASGQLAKAILERVGIDKVAEIKAKLYGSEDPRGWIASLAPTVLGLAQSGDSAAQQIVSNGVRHLADAACHAAARFGETTSRPPIRLAGGLLVGSPLYRHGLTERLLAEAWRADQIVLAPDGAIGCALLAAQLGQG